MPRVRIDNVGAIGVIKDVPAYELPPNAWSDCQNIRFQDGSAHKAKGYADLWTNPEADPYFLTPVSTPAAYYWVYCGLNKVYAIQNQYHFDITRPSGDYQGNVYWRWNSGNLGGVIILNNGVDVPQYWEFPTSHSNRLQDLTGWPSTDRCRVIRPFKNFLVATNIERSGTLYPTLVKWSHPASIGNIPSSWDETDPTLDAGENGLPQEGGDIFDQKALRDINILYRSDSTWAMQFIGAPLIFRFWALFKTSGILAQECSAEFFGSHFVVTQDDVVVHDGQNIQSVANNKIRRQIFSDISSSTYDRSFVTHNRADKEIWFCYPGTGATLPNQAWVWSYKENSWACRDLPSIAHAEFGVVDVNAQDAWDAARGSWNSQSSTWASATQSWAADDVAWSFDDKPWNYRTYDSQLLDLMYAEPTNKQLFKGDDTNQNNASNMVSTLTRTGLGIIGPDKIDLYSRKQIRAIYPRIEGTSGGVVNVYCGYQNSVGDPVKWSAPQPYTIGSTYKCDFNVDGRLIAVKYESTTDIEWRLHSYQMDIEVSGDR